jgi:zinc transporter 1/2/3
MLACSGYLLTMLGDCVVVYVTSNSQREAKVEELEGGRTPQEGDGTNELAMDESNVAFMKTTNVGDTILLILALCFHSVFEGIAVGVSGLYFIYSLSLPLIWLCFLFFCVYLCIHQQLFYATPS